jgi:oligopeptide transport system ATP-binding protein
MTSLNPYLTVGRQLGEVLEVHKGASAAQARARSLAMLERVGIPEAARRLDQYPHELSGGMRQRVMIAMALLCEPELLIADEPTTALDVTIQAQILDLLAELRRELGMAIALVTHDLGVIAGLTDRVLVLYAGRVVEEAPVEALFAAPRHPYTRGLLRSMPRLSGPLPEALEAIQGQPPDLVRLPKGCAFAPRCPQVHARCRVEPPELRPAGPGRRVACHLEAPA